MNLDLLTKLVKLANNNPNENEANLAARKVCKLIQEGDFKFNGVAQKPPSGPTIRTASNPSSPGSDWMRDFYTKPPDPAKQNAPWTYKPSEEQRKYYEDLMRDFITVDFDSDPYANPYTKKRPAREKRPLKCSRCGVEQQTAFVGPPQVYVCHACHWKDFKQREGHE